MRDKGLIVLAVIAALWYGGIAALVAHALGFVALPVFALSVTLGFVIAGSYGGILATVTLLEEMFE